MALNAPYTPNTVIQSTQVSNDLTGLANGTNDTANNSMSTFRSENFYDCVVSGCVWSGDAYASTRNGSQTSGVVYIAGVRLPVLAVSAHLFTASKDTYIDINGSGVQVYTEATNNAASPALAAGSLRIGIIITGATTIAAATSVNQGQETMVLPIASSIAYSVTDSLGNLICNRNPDRTILGFRQIIANLSSLSAVTDTQVTGLSVPIIAPASRKVKVTLGGGVMLGVTGAQNTTLKIWEGVVVSGVQKQASAYGMTAGAFSYPGLEAGALTPSSTNVTYNISYAVSANAVTFVAAAAAPIWVKVELV